MSSSKKAPVPLLENWGLTHTPTKIYIYFADAKSSIDFSELIGNQETNRFIYDASELSEVFFSWKLLPFFFLRQRRPCSGFGSAVSFWSAWVVVVRGPRPLLEEISPTTSPTDYRDFQSTVD
jgi:hypothetical protein